MREGEPVIEKKKIESIDITLSPEELKEMRDKGELRDKRVVVVDVLRATSTIVSAFQNGAMEVVPVATVEEARELKNKLGEKVLLCGERGGKALPGFDLGNSPREYTKETVKDKVIIFTTSHGAQTMDAARGSREIIIASSLNASAVGQYLQKEGGNIVLAASGSAYAKPEIEEKEKDPGREDVVIGCGFVLKGLLENNPKLEKQWLKRLAQLSRGYESSSIERIKKGLLTSRWGKEMLKLDKTEGTDYRGKDIEWIAENTNKIGIVPIMETDGRIRIKKSND